MVNKKQKLQIIDDYIKILKLEIFLPFHNNKKVKVITRLKEIYDKIFFKLGMFDNALAMLKDDFKMDNNTNYKNCSEEAFCKLENEVQCMITRLPKFLNSLGFNDLENKYILNG